MISKRLVIPIFIPHMGCENSCVFCNQKSISGEEHEMTVEKAEKTILEYLKNTEKFSYVEIAFFGGSFTGIPINKQIEFLNLAQKYIDNGYVNSIRMSTRPDYISTDILEFLNQYSVGMIELGAQSLNDDVLKKSRRGHSKEDVVNASNLIKEYGIKLGIQTMIGLPEDTWDKALNTAKKVIEINPSTIRIYPALVVKNTELYNMFINNEYTPLPLDIAIEWVSKLIVLYEKAGIDIARVGLQSTDKIQLGRDVVAGPFHNSIRQLAESNILYNIITEKIYEAVYPKENSTSEYLRNESLCYQKHIEKCKITNLNKNSIEIYCSNKNVSNVIGQKKMNIVRLKKQFGFNNISVIPKNNFTGREITIQI